MSEAILVGNSNALLTRGLGSEIDDFRVIVRMNGGAPMPEQREALGCITTHWSYSTLSCTQYMQWKSGFRFSVVEMCLNPRCKYDFANEPAYKWDEVLHNEFIQHYGHARPSTGLITANYIKTVLGLPLTIAGFDFFKTGSWYMPTRKHAPHDWEREERYMLDVLGAEVLDA